MIKLIIFDWDDVFTTGATKAYFKCYQKAALSVGVKLPNKVVEERILKNWGKNVEAEITGLLKENPQLVLEATKRYEEILFGDTFVDCLEVVEGAREFLKRLSKKYILCISTGVNPKLLKIKIMPKFDIPQVFSQIVSVYDNDDPQKGKPHPFMVNKILKDQKIKPNEAILVGDAKNDVLMARAAGLMPVVVLTGHLTKAEAKKMKVEYIIEDVTKLESIF